MTVLDPVGDDMTIEAQAEEIERLTTEVRGTFEAGYQFGLEDARHNYPARPRGAYNEWRKSTDADEQCKHLGSQTEFRGGFITCDDCGEQITEATTVCETVVQGDQESK